ncbi:FliH/SctL family protein [Frigidibacter oleivorans]|uniref:FliH/SctL family protein n=1 Tax=Frigidibacter oleivorans TaxID=2487129 RepID=UPI000F8EFBAD|nr:FliH/SctL family protein [Frigidibacter oleivorans]
MPDGSGTPEMRRAQFTPLPRPTAAGGAPAGFIPAAFGLPGLAAAAGAPRGGPAGFRAVRPAAMVTDRLPVPGRMTAASLAGRFDPAPLADAPQDAAAPTVADVLAELPSAAANEGPGDAAGARRDQDRDGSAEPDIGIAAESATPAAEAAAADARAAAYAEGHAAGRLDGLRQARDDMAEQAQDVAATARALAAALAALDRPDAGATAQLTAALDRAVARLAADRAGMAIDSHPAAFLDRIAALAERIDRQRRGLVLHLNPRDLAAVRAALPAGAEAEPAFAATRMRADPALARGDVELRAPGAHLRDLLAEVPEAEADGMGVPDTVRAGMAGAFADSPR